MNLITLAENGVANSCGYRKSKQADIVDTLHDWLNMTDGAFFINARKLANMFECNEKTVRRALNDERSPFSLYVVVQKDEYDGVWSNTGWVIAWKETPTSYCYFMPGHPFDRWSKPITKLKLKGEAISTPDIPQPQKYEPLSWEVPY